MEKPSVSIMISALAIVLAISMGVYGAGLLTEHRSDITDLQNEKAQDLGPLTQDVTDIKADIKEIQGNVTDIQVDVTALETYDDIITSEIGKINSKIKDEVQTGHPAASEGEETTSSKLLLTLEIPETEYVRGNTVLFSGSVVLTSQPVIVQLKLPDRSLEQVGISTASIIDGQWSGNYTIRLDDPLGTWEIYATQKAERTRTISFSVE